MVAALGFVFVFFTSSEPDFVNDRRVKPGRCGTWTPAFFFLIVVEASVWVFFFFDASGMSTGGDDVVAPRVRPGPHANGLSTTE